MECVVTEDYPLADAADAATFALFRWVGAAALIAPHGSTAVQRRNSCES